MKLVLYWTDILVWIFFILSAWFCYIKRQSPLFKDIAETLFKHSRYMVSCLIVSTFVIIGLLDSIHFQSLSQGYYTQSVLDVILSPRDRQHEKTYSAPFALKSFSEEFEKNEQGEMQVVYPPLTFAGNQLTGTLQEKEQTKINDILQRVALGFFYALLALAVLYIISPPALKRKESFTAVRAFWVTSFFIFAIISLSAMLMFEYHILGTDKVGRDVFYMSIKSIRTGLVIGTVTSFVMLPFALSMGVWAGYFRGAVDDMIQYLYTTLGSIPGVLLIAAAILSFQVKIEEDPDLKLLLLCVVLGATGWIGLCRLLRGETLKLREADFVQAARALGVSHFKILRKHIIPNLMHIVIINVVLDFSGLVLAESILSYVGVGVSSSTFSWGNMINAARLEMAREPMVWWSLSAALVFMFTLVFSANILGDGVQQALNPKGR